MRFVDNTFIDLPDGWEDRAEAATQDLINGNIVADDRSAIWKELKESLELLSNGRCWYCETNIPRTDNAVDHYRPKGTVKGVSIDEGGKDITRYDIAPEHLGYKWAAFKEENFRFSCQHCNEFRKDLQGTAGGKWNYFPLIDETERAYNELDEDNENPSLLDPCKRLDWRMLSYDKSGAPFSRYPEGSEEDLKVKYSIRLYHLDQKRLNEGRLAQWNLFKPLIIDAKKWYLKKLRRDQGAEACFQNELRKIGKWFNPKSKHTYLGYLVYQLEQDKDKDDLHSWISELIKTVG
ncbi:hypothetical protein C3B51_16295 [Pseudoalteromonas rubra]|uniref:HNH endonuclease n=1 Tax=Pseudoalteromonas rubra TaxID=43658 RepID=A0A4V2E296_9GAMM|nr:hypothetical protein [Pseudoalteromonas rubra]RZM77493.1 hypothetical protein C3B51_16295 [Pseudoalteromonas rubra]